MAETLKVYLIRHLHEVQALSTEERLKKRYERYRACGHFIEAPSVMAVSVENSQPTTDLVQPMAVNTGNGES
jgi:hypothetical protein